MFARLITILFALLVHSNPIALGQQQLPSDLGAENTRELQALHDTIDLSADIPAYDQSIVLDADIKAKLDTFGFPNRDVITIEGLIGDLQGTEAETEIRTLEDLIRAGGGDASGPFTLPRLGGPQDRPPKGGGPIFDPPGGLPRVPLAQGDLRNQVGRGDCSQGLLERYGKISANFGISPFDKPIFDAFQKECLPMLPPLTISVVSDGSTPASMTAEDRLLAEMHRIEARVVLLKHAGQNANLCTGLAVDRTVVLTAAHCFASSDADPFKVDETDLSNYTVTNGSGVTVEVLEVIAAGADAALDHDLQKVSRGDLGSDIVLVRLSAPVEQSSFDFTPFPETLEAGTPLVLFGRRNGEAETSENRIAVVRNEGCRLHFDFTAESERIFHQCVTEGGMSGGPIFGQAADGALYFLGVHQSGAVIADVETATSKSFPKCIIAADWCDSALKAYRFLNVGHFVSLADFMEGQSDA